MPLHRPAVVLLSGGLDSTTVLAIAQSAGFATYAVSFRYGQRHAFELTAAERIAYALHAERHVIVDFDLRTFGGSALTSEVAVPKGRAFEDMTKSIPITYVPARNTIFLRFSLACSASPDSTTTPVFGSRARGNPGVSV